MKNLIIAMVNENSVHEHWLTGWSSELGWDVALFNYGKGQHTGTISLDKYISPPKFKWQMVNQLLDSTFPFDEFGYIWLVDDDIEMSAVEISDFFKKCEELSVTLAQPSLTHNSYVTHPVTLKHEGMKFRKTNFVEIMMPCFSSSSWKKLKETPRFNTLTGWGLELFWGSILFSKKSPFHVMDDVSVRHGRPLGFGRYKWLPEGYDVQDAMVQEVIKHKLDRRSGWFRCNIELALLLDKTISYNHSDFIEALAKSVGASYRSNVPEVAGLQYIKLSNKINPADFSKLREVPVHAAFGEYILSHLWLDEYAYM